MPNDCGPPFFKEFSQDTNCINKIFRVIFLIPKPEQSYYFAGKAFFFNGREELVSASVSKSPETAKMKREGAKFRA